MVDGLRIAYELHGPGAGAPVVLTPGGRFSMDAPGVRELATELAGRGRRVRIWGRPNTGASDVAFGSESESALHADVLAGLLRRLDFGRTAIVGGSAGSRVSLLVAARHPDVTGALCVWWITGGFFGLLTLASHYCGEHWAAAVRGGMEAVCALPGWQETFAKNPVNRDRMLAMDPREFAARMEAWGPTFLEPADSPVPGMTPADFAGIAVPTLVFRGSATDTAHPRRTSERVHELIPGSRLEEPPWGDEEWNERTAENRAAAAGDRLFRNWPRLAGPLSEFLDSVPR